jgi:polyhydroxyalkanoate synthesis regulator phasin
MEEKQVDQILALLRGIDDRLKRIEQNLEARIAGLERRVAALETKLQLNPTTSDVFP